MLCLLEELAEAEHINGEGVALDLFRIINAFLTLDVTLARNAGLLELGSRLVKEVV